MVCIKFNIQKSRCRRGGGVPRIRPGSPEEDEMLAGMLRGLDWTSRHEIFNAWLCARQVFVSHVMGPDELLRGRSHKVYKGRVVELPDTPYYFVQPPPKRRRMRQLTLSEIIHGVWGYNKPPSGGGDETKVARGGGDKASVARGGGGKTKVALGVEV
jgi:hypothetical protein